MQTLGLQIDKPFIRAALVELRQSGFKICALKSAPLSEPDHVKALYMGNFKGRLISGLSSKDFVFRSMDLQIGKTRHIKAALMFQAEAATHLNPTDAISIPHGIKRFEGKVEASIFAASRAAIQSSLDDFQKLQIDLDGMSCYGLALVSYVRWKAPSLTDAFLIDLGSNEWTCVLMEKGEMKKTHSLDFGTESLLMALWEDRKKILLPKEVEGIARQIDLQQIKPNLNPHLSEKLREMRQELGKVIFSFHRIANQKPIIFTGHIDAFGHLREYLIESFKEAISHEFDDNFEIEERKYAIPIGLALEQAKEPLQLLTKEFFPRKNWRKAGLYALLLFFFSIGLSALFLSVGLHLLSERKDSMIQSAERTIHAWDPQLKELLFQNEERALEEWATAVSLHQKEYPYILDVPKVGEVLSWLSHNPLLQQFAAEGDPLELKDLHYELIDYPKIGSPQNRYQAKVELQFKIKSAMNARKFHELLLQGDEIIDSSREIGWEPSIDSYRTSFFLHSRRPDVS